MLLFLLILFLLVLFLLILFLLILFLFLLGFLLLSRAEGEATIDVTTRCRCQNWWGWVKKPGGLIRHEFHKPRSKSGPLRLKAFPGNREG